MDLLKQALNIAGDPKQTRWICPLLLLADAVLCCLVVWKVPCTCLVHNILYIGPLLNEDRHRNRLGSVHATNRTIH